MIRKIEVERFTLSSSKPFDQVVAALNSAVGHPDMSEFWKSTHRAQSAAELQSTIEKVLGRTGLMLFARVRPRRSCAQRNRSRYTEDDPLCHWQSTHHARDGRACARCRIVRPGNNSDRRAS